MKFVQPAADADPFELFRCWYDAYAKMGPKLPDAMTLATAGLDGRPSARTVLLKGVEGGAFRFFTNYQSRKARELNENPRAALLFFWPAADRQIRIEGDVSPIAAAESEEYFATRPRESQLSAYASPQSREISRADLLEQRAAAARRFQGRPVPRPENWGGYDLVPRAFEFWVNEETRLHHRYTYRRGARGWDFVELAP